MTWVWILHSVVLGKTSNSEIKFFKRVWYLRIGRGKSNQISFFFHFFSFCKIFNSCYRWKCYALTSTMAPGLIGDLITTRAFLHSDYWLASSFSFSIMGLAIGIAVCLCTPLLVICLLILSIHRSCILWWKECMSLSILQLNSLESWNFS